MTGESGGGSAPSTGVGGISVSGLTSAGSSFLGKQFSFTSGKSSTSASSGLGDSVISTQPSPKPAEKPVDARSDTSSTSTLTAGSVSSSSKPSSSVLDTYDQESKYKPVTNFEPQERVNPFDKGAMKTSTTTTTIGGVSTTSSSSISSSSISSRINARTDSTFKSPPPPSRPPPPPPQNASIATNSSTTYQSSTASNKDKTSYIYGSSTSIETITRMDTTTATGNTVSNATASTSLGQSSQGTANTKLRNDTANTTTTDWRTAITAPLNTGTRSASVYSAPAAVTVPATGSEDAQSTAAASNGYNAATDLPSYTRPSYSRSESNGSNNLNKSSDLDIIFGDSQPVLGNGKFTRSGGSLSDAELIFGTPSSAYKTDRFGTSKSMSVTSDRTSSSYGQSNSSANNYKIYEGIQNAAFSDFSDAKKSDSQSSIPSYNSWRNSSKHLEEEDDLDLK
ncbi:Synapsin [Lucilia cuprina]|nr:Synapsin [Lucilia cuprina]